MLQGSCACGKVRYEVQGGLVFRVAHCHCWQCRKHSGASFGTTSAVLTSEFSVVEGEDQIRYWESSPGIRRHFAGCCGSPIYKTNEALPDFLAFRMGTLDTDPGKTVEEHIFVDSKVPWIELSDDLPKKDGGVPFGERDDGPAG